MNRHIAAAATITAVMLAGCTSLPGATGGGDEPASQGLVIKEASLENRRIAQDRSTRLIVRLANTQPDPLKKVKVSVSNTGSVAAEAPDSGQLNCKGKSFKLAAAVDGIPTEKTCVWKIKGNKASPGTYPLTVAVTYTDTLTMQRQSPRITFDPDRQVAAATTSRSYSNGELSLSVRYPSAVPANPGSAPTIETEFMVSNAGNGRIVGYSKEGCTVTGGRCVDFMLGGTIKEAGYTGSNGCSHVVFVGDDQQARTDCNLKPPGSISGSGVTSHTFRVDATYRYRQRRELPLRVVKAPGS